MIYRLSLFGTATLGLAGFAMGAPARAQDDRTPQIDTPEVVGKLFKCREIADPTERLACFDREVGAVQAARESRELVMAEREQVEEAQRGLFGLKLPKLVIFGSGEDSQLDTLTAKITRATRMDNGLYLFELEDGARWMQTESAAGYRRYEAGDEIEISRGALGSFKAKVNGGRALRVTRVN